MARISVADVLLSLPALLWPGALVVAGIAAIDGVAWLAPALPENAHARVAVGVGLLLAGVSAFSCGITERLGLRRRLETIAWSVEVVCLWAGLLMLAAASFRS
ncbi:MAG: hypothetical protein AAF108_09285 [Planctomycetota bacterium]